MHPLLSAWFQLALAVVLIGVLLALQGFSHQKLSWRVWRWALLIAVLCLIPALMDLIPYYLHHSLLPRALHVKKNLVASACMLAAMAGAALELRNQTNIHTGGPNT